MIERPFVFRVNENGGGPSLLLQVFAERGWVNESRGANNEDGGAGQSTREKWNLWWRTSCQPFHQYRNLKSWQFVNRIPEATSICKKDQLARCLKTMSSLFGAIYDFSPKTYIMPVDYTKLVMGCSQHHHANERIWICKPVGRSQGRGITVFRKASELICDAGSSVVQEYVKQPLLIGGYKFDLRLYVCVPCYHPLVIYVYREGLARFGTARFSLTELDNRCAHLTNSSINKHAPGYLELKDKVGAGCKWSLKQLRFYLYQNGLDDWLMWQKISNIITLTVASQLAGVPSTKNCFEFYGFDILIDTNLKPWLIEVNNSPALCSDCDLDPAIKKPMLHDLLDLISLPMCNTGLSIVSDWGDPYDYAASDISSDSDRSLHQNSHFLAGDEITSSTAVTIRKIANRWKKQIPSNSQKKPVKEGRSIRAAEKKFNTSSNRPECDTQRRSTNKGRSKSGREKPNHIWENGVDWEADAPEDAGGWVRIFPALSSELPTNGGPKGRANQGRSGPGEVRSIVALVSRASRMANTIFQRYPNNDDEIRDQAMGHTGLWHPAR